MIISGMPAIDHLLNTIRRQWYANLKDTEPALQWLIDDDHMEWRGNEAYGDDCWEESCSVTAGLIDDRATYLFQSGQCHALALAGWEATGWPIVWLTSDEGPEPEPHHLMLVHPNNELVDITGLNDPVAKLQTFRRVHIVTAATVYGHIDCNWPTPAVSAARTMWPEVERSIDLELAHQARSARGSALAL